MKLNSAFVLGAGLGTRLKSLTRERPKPLIPVGNKPLITYAFDHLLEAGVERMVVNTHRRAEAYAKAFPEGAYRGMPVKFRHESPEVLETAGGIKNVEDLLGSEPFIVYNGDILTDLPLDPAIRSHFDNRSEVTMVLRSKDGPLQVAFDHSKRRVTDIGKRLNPASAADFLFTGIYLISPEFFARIPACEKVSVIPIFLEMIRGGAKLGGIVIDEGRWWDWARGSNILPFIKSALLNRHGSIRARRSPRARRLAERPRSALGQRLAHMRVCTIVLCGRALRSPKAACSTNVLLPVGRG